MLRAIIFSCLAVASFGKLHQWGLLYKGNCETDADAATVTCDAKASSETFTAFLDPYTGVDWQLDEEKYGPVAYLHVVETFNADGTFFTAKGNSTFGTHSHTHTTIDFEYDSTDMSKLDSPDDIHHIVVGFANVTGGTGAWDSAVGTLTFNTLADSDGKFEPFLFGSLVVSD